MNSKDTIFCTIASKNYLGQVRVLAASLKKHHPDVPMVLLLTDRIDGYFDPKKEPFEIMEIDQLAIPALAHFCFWYTVIELNTAAKPYFLKALLDRKNCEKVIYLDPDIKVFQPLDPILDNLNKYAVVVTPHIDQPIEDPYKPSEMDILQAGSYNLGFLGVSKQSDTFKLLHWWQDRLYRDCKIDFPNGYHVDQKWIDLAPSLIDSFHVMRQPGFNVAYWNFHCRQLISSGDTILLADGSPLYFFHFSGYHPARPGIVSKHQTRSTMADLGLITNLFDEYRQDLFDSGFHESSQWPYAFKCFDNQVLIPDVARRHLRELNEMAFHFEDPFVSKARKSYFEYLRTSRDGQLSPLMKILYDDLILDNPVLKQTIVPNLNELHRGVWDIWLRHHQIDTALWPVSAMTMRPTGRPGDKEFGVNLAGFFESEKGVGESVRLLKKVLEARGVPLVLNNHVDVGSANQDCQDDHFQSVNPYPINLMSFNANAVADYYHVHGMSYFLNRYNIGVWNWELPEFPPEWEHAFMFFDEIWAPSRFTQAAIASVSPIPVRWMPYAIEVPKSLPSEFNRRYYQLRENAFLFLFTFDFHSFLERKNPLMLIRAFKKAFQNRSDVQLILKVVHQKDTPREYQEMLNTIAGAENIQIIDSLFTRQEMYGLMNQIDAFISLHRAEGFGLNLAEAMAYGKAVIATNYSSNTDFMNSANSYPVNYKMVQLQDSYGPYAKGQWWADPDEEHAIELMREVVTNREQAKQIGLRAAHDIAESFSVQVVGERMLKTLHGLWRQSPRFDEKRFSPKDITLALPRVSRIRNAWWQITRGYFGPPPNILRSIKKKATQLTKSVTQPFFRKPGTPVDNQ